MDDHAVGRVLRVAYATGWLQGFLRGAEDRTGLPLAAFQVIWKRARAHGISYGALLAAGRALRVHRICQDDPPGVWWMLPDALFRNGHRRMS
jgi:hypothetical protein